MRTSIRKKSLYYIIAVIISLMVLLLFPKIVRAEEPMFQKNRSNQNDSVLVVFNLRKNIENEKQYLN